MLGTIEKWESICTTQIDDLTLEFQVKNLTKGNVVAIHSFFQ